MKNINYVVNGVLAVAVIILFILHFTGKKESGTPNITFVSGEESTPQLPIAYINMDSLLLNYNYYNDINEVLMRKEENYRANITQKSNSLRNEINDFQRKLENNAFLTRERAENEQNRLMRKQQELQDQEAQYAEELYNEQQKVIEQLRDTLLVQVKIYNKDKGYQMIFSNTMSDNIIIADEVYDITMEVVELLNKNYSSPGN